MGFQNTDGTSNYNETLVPVSDMRSTFAENWAQVNRNELGGVIVQAVNRRVPTAEARARAKVMSCGISGGQSGNGRGFL
jgi:hypothetical protein